MGDYESLVEMGFDPRRVTFALKLTKGFNDAITWLADNEDTPIEDLEAKHVTSTSGSSGGDRPGKGITGPTVQDDPFGEQGEGDGSPAVGPEAKSLKCTECGKLFNTPAKAQFHASRTQHEDFEESTEEIKPMTEEEKTAHLEMLKQKLKEKRAQQTIDDIKSQRANELIRRKHDVEADRIKEDLRKRELTKEAEKRKKEKQEDAVAREKIRAQIKADQDARRHEEEQRKAAREGKKTETPATPATPATSLPAPPQPKPDASYTEARLNFRFPTGDSLQKKFPAETTLSEVASVIETERGFSPSTFTTTFPRKVYNRSDFGLTLKEAKWIPSVALLVG